MVDREGKPSFNPCTASGCKAACCKNMLLETSTYERQSAFPTAQEVNSEFDLAYEDKKGVYFTADTQEPGNEVVRIIGRCPNLLPNNNCGIYDQRPEACNTGLEIGTSDCKKARRQYGLPAVTKSQIISLQDIK